MTLLTSIVRRLPPLAAGCALLLAPASAPAQHHAAGVRHGTPFPPGTSLLVPQSGAFTPGRKESPLRIDSVDVTTRVRNTTASTTMDVHVHNTTAQRQELVLLLPLPFDAIVTGFDFAGSASEPTARLLPREEARRTYDSIVAQVRDPALLEFAGWNLVRSSVFPVEPNQSQRVVVSFDHLLAVDGPRVDLMIPRSETHGADVRWNISVDVESETPLADAWSPTHALHVSRPGETRLLVRTAENAASTPGPFRLTILRALEASSVGVITTVIAAPDPSVAGGQFLLLATLDPRIPAATTDWRRELILVLDCSGSMAGAKFDQARQAARSMLDDLDDADSFNIVAYANGVRSLFEAPRGASADAKSAAERFLASLKPLGGTNIHDAIVEALRQSAGPADRRDVILLTDGLPTVGRTSESVIRAAAEKGNPHRRRVHAVGVGTDVNVPLLDRIADRSRGTATYLPAGERIAEPIGRLAGRLARPALVDLAFEPQDGEEGLVDCLPALLPDLNAGEQLVVVGRYLDGEPRRAILRGTLRGREVAIPIVIDPAQASVQNTFVSRLWASRRVAELIDMVRQAAADGRFKGPLHEDPAYAGIPALIVQIATQYGILTEYTSFLALEGTRLDRSRDIVATCGEQLRNLAADTRWGAAAVAQGINYNQRKVQQQLNLDNRFVNETLNETRIENVHQVADRGLFKRGDTWVDGRLVTDGGTLAPSRTIEFGSDDHRRLLENLCTSNRQALLSLPGQILLEVDGQSVLIRNDW